MRTNIQHYQSRIIDIHVKFFNILQDMQTYPEKYTSKNLEDLSFSLFTIEFNHFLGDLQRYYDFYELDYASFFKSQINVTINIINYFYKTDSNFKLLDEVLSSCELFIKNFDTSFENEYNLSKL